MAGHMIYNYFLSKNIYNITCISESDIFSNGLLISENEFTSNFNQDYIINCIRCLVNDSELNPAKAISYNSFFPRLLEKNYEKTKTKLIHLSTDCVFSGKDGDYSEDSMPDGQSVYARTKMIGEIINNKDVTIRTSYIGPNIEDINEELFDWLFLQKGEIYGYNNVFWTGITTLELAKGIEDLIKLDFSGLYHMVPKNKISKYELLHLIKRVWEKDDITITIDKSNVIDRSLIDNQKLINISNYDTMFINLYKYMNENYDLYQKYSISN